MSAVLRLAYACTPAERAQARSLLERKRYGGGSKWRARLVLLLLFVGMMLAAWFRFREIPETYRALILSSIVAGSVLVVFVRNKFRKSDSEPTRLEASGTDLMILGPESKLTLPWSAFSECLESPDLFVLRDRPNQIMLIVLKRAFPSEDWQQWFREQAAQGPSRMAPAWNELPATGWSASTDRVVLTIHLGFRDYLARTVASWRTWGFCMVVGTVILGTSAYALLQNPPAPAIAPATLLLVFIVPLFLVCLALAVFLFSFCPWLSNARRAGSQEMALSEDAVTFAGTGGSGTVAWTQFKHYKETPWHFILWRGSVWIMLPKRAFASWEDVRRCRDLLERHLERSRWFLG